MVSVVGATLAGFLWLAFGSGVFDIAALKRGAFHMTKAKLVGVEMTLYRDATGSISIVNALRSQPPTVQRTLYLPPREDPDGEPWLLEVGPIEVEDALPTLGFTKKPVVFQVDRAKVTVRRRTRVR